MLDTIRIWGVPWVTEHVHTYRRTHILTHMHTGDRTAICESRDFYRGGIRRDQAVTDGQEVCSVLRGDAHNPKGGCFSSYNQLFAAYWLLSGLGREPIIVKLLNNYLTDRSWDPLFFPVFSPVKTQQETWTQVWILKLIRTCRSWTRLERKPQRSLKHQKIEFMTKGQPNFDYFLWRRKAFKYVKGYSTEGCR